MGDALDNGRSEFIRLIYKSGSPSSGRHENRIKELEELLDLDREVRNRLERENIELSDQLGSINEAGKNSCVSSSQYNEAIRRRDGDIVRLRKEAEVLSLQVVTSEQDIKKKTHAVITDMKLEIENLQKLKLKAEKDRMILLTELESTLVQTDAMAKQKATLAAKLENVESQLMRTTASVEDMGHQIKEATTSKAMIEEENTSLRSVIKDITHQNSSIKKQKSNLEFQLDESRQCLEEEVRLKEQAQVQGHRLQSDNGQLNVQIEDEAESRVRLQQQFAWASGEAVMLRSKYECDITEMSREAEELRKKSSARIVDLTEDVAKEHARVMTLEKNRQLLTLEVAELNAELGRNDEELENLRHSLKSMESTHKDLDKQLQESSNEATILRMANGKLSSQNCRLRVNMEEEEHKNKSLAKTNYVLEGELIEAKERVHSISNELSEVHCTRLQLESERGSMAASLEERKEVLVDMERKYQYSHEELMKVRTIMDQELTEKGEELDSVRKTSQRTIESLSATLTELETKYRTEINKMKKKCETKMLTLEENVRSKHKDNIELKEEIQTTNDRLKEVEAEFEELKQDLLLAHEKVSSSERRRLQVQGDLDDSNRLLEAADRSRHNIQMEIESISDKSADYVAKINSLANDKRKLENEVAALKTDLYDFTIYKLDNEERASKLSNEANVLMDELKQEQELSRKCEAQRKSLAQELKDAKTRLDNRESLVAKDMSKNVEMYEERIKALESEVECERSRNKEHQVLAKKQERLMKDLQNEADDEKNAMLELQHLLEGAQTKVGAYKRQVDELEAVNAETMTRYRRLQKQMNEVEYKTVSVVGRRELLRGPDSRWNSHSDSKSTGAW